MPSTGSCHSTDKPGVAGEPGAGWAAAEAEAEAEEGSVGLVTTDTGKWTCLPS